MRKMKTLDETTFKSKQEIDRWYNTTVNGMIRALSTQRLTESDRVESSGYPYKRTLRGLNELREQMYPDLNIQETPEALEFTYIIRKAYRLPKKL